MLYPLSYGGFIGGSRRPLQKQSSWSLPLSLALLVSGYAAIYKTMGGCQGGESFRPHDYSKLEATLSVCERLRPRQESNLRSRLRRPMLYPLSYEGGYKKSDMLILN